MSKIEWDENKRLSNIAKHGFDFLDVEEVIYGIHVVIASRYAGEEQRWSSTGKIHGRFATVVFTMRGDDYRIISIRSARDNERREYEKLYS